MNNKTLLLIATVCLLAVNTVFAQSSLFTYQGTLNTNGAPYSGSAEFQFTLWDAATNGNSVATNNPTSVITTVANGLFTVTLDFGISPFNGDPRFLQTDVRTTIGPFTSLTPRQPITATPYAMRALNLTTNGLVSGAYGNALTFNNAGNSFAGAFNGAFTGSYTGNGVNISNVNALTLGGVPSTGYWKTNGNSGANPTNGAFIGTTDNLPLEFRVNSTQRALRIEPANATAPNLIGGAFINYMGSNVFGSFIGGGGAFFDTNLVLSAFGAIGGGDGNEILTNVSASTIGGGYENVIGGIPPLVFSVSSVFGYDFIGGGWENGLYPGTFACSIPGGQDNRIETNATHCSIGGGFFNDIPSGSTYATIPGGQDNLATSSAFAAGSHAKAKHTGAFVWADSQSPDFASTATNQFLIRASGGVGINTASPTRDVEVQNSGDVELGLRSKDTGGHLWTVQSSSVSGSANLDASFQIVDRTVGSARLFIGTNGNVGIGTSSPTNKLHVNGGITCTALVQTSDRNAKENFAPISPDEVLAKVAALPISSWNYKEMRDGRHLGPMAQDFYAAFQLGGSETTITAVDTEGVALAAIQGLNQKLSHELKTKDAEISELKTRLQKLEVFVEKMAGETK